MSNYRNELDGLRAVAVLSVIIYHAQIKIFGINLLTGGFLGVDIFFVLSGFLITGILLDKNPPIFTFYKSRFDRIYPALVLALFACCVCSYFILVPSDILNFIEQLKGAMLFFSNYMFMYENSYIADSSKYKILLHSWSLAVEWQFYMLFPFIVYTIKRFFKNDLEQVFIILSSISFFYCIYLMQVNQNFAFYSTPSRAWELFVGGLVFLLSKKIKKREINNILSILGIMIVFYLLIFIKDTDAHPGFISLICVVGTSLFILFIQEKSLVYKIFTVKPMVFVGVISYSLYLYHQPILVFYRFLNQNISNKEFAILLLSMLVVSYISYAFFESPIRKSKNNRKYIIVLILTSSLVVFYNYAKYTSGYVFRQTTDASTILKHFEKPEYTRLQLEPYGLRISSHSRTDDVEQKDCDGRIPSTSCKIQNNGKELLIVGDSFAGVFTYIFSEQKNFNIKFFTHQQCPFLMEGIWFGTRPECSDINKLRWAEIEKMNPTNILIGTDFGLFSYGKEEVPDYILGKTLEAKKHISKQEIYQSFKKAIAKLIELNHNPIILLQPPSPSIDPDKEMKLQIQKGVLSFENKWDAIPTTAIDKEVKTLLKDLNVTFIDLNRKMCTNNKCLTQNKDGSLYNGGGHLSYFGAKLFVEDIIKNLR